MEVKDQELAMALVPGRPARTVRRKAYTLRFSTGLGKFAPHFIVE
jgi:hypothetical protein